MHLQLHQLLPESYANGPGRRAVLWVQGCTLNCRGCFNPSTHPAATGTTVAVAELVARLQTLAVSASLEGITLSGGEPLQQSAAVLALLQGLRGKPSGDSQWAQLGTERSSELPSLSVLLFTGYTWEELVLLPLGPAVLEYVDVVIAGRYEAPLHLGTGLIGSSNQTVHFLTHRYSWADLAAVPAGEVVIDAAGVVQVSGIDPPRRLFSNSPLSQPTGKGK